MSLPMHNAHIHTFTSQHVPSHFKTWPLMPIIRSKFGGWLAKKILPWVKGDAGGRLAAFAHIGNLGKQEDIYDFVASFYPPDTRFVVLAMDMDHMGAGTAPQPYSQQLEQLAKLQKDFPDNIRAFVAADPRRDNLLTTVKNHIDMGFWGIKLYPPLGFFPFDPNLLPVYEYAEKNLIPVLSHCSPGGVYYEGRFHTEMREELEKHGGPIRGQKNGEITDRYAHPFHYRKVLDQFPKLKLCLAHYGGGDQWRAHMRDPWRRGDVPSWLSAVDDLIRKYDNVYADVSSTVADPITHPLMKVQIEDSVLGPRILYGSDFYMVQRQVTEREFSINFRGYIGESNWKKIACTNPDRFLGDVH